MSCDDNKHHVFTNSKYFGINELNAIKTKWNHFDILSLNIASRNKHMDSLSDVLSLMKFNVSFIDLSEHKIGPNI